jgi:glutamyl-tRNA synthetase
LAAKLTPPRRSQLLAAMGGLKERAKTLVELADGAHFIVAERPLRLDQKAAAVLTIEARSLLRELSHDLRDLEPWNAVTTEQASRAFAERRGIRLGSIAQPLRAALTGRVTSPPIFQVLAVLGKEESFSRLDDQLSPAIANRQMTHGAGD